MTQNINLYDPALRVHRDWLSLEVVAVIVGTTVLAVAVAAGTARSSRGRLEPTAQQGADTLQAQQTVMQDLARQVLASRPDATLQAEVVRAQGSVLQRRNALKMLSAGALGQVRGHADGVRAIARQAIDGLWLTGIALRSQNIALRGRTLDPALIPAYVQRLNREAALQGHSFKALSIERPLEAESAASAPGQRAGGSGSSPLASFVEFSLTGSDDGAAPGATVQIRP